MNADLLTGEVAGWSLLLLGGLLIGLYYLHRSQQQHVSRRLELEQALNCLAAQHAEVEKVKERLMTENQTLMQTIAEFETGHKQLYATLQRKGEELEHLHSQVIRLEEAQQAGMLALNETREAALCHEQAHRRLTQEQYELQAQNQASTAMLAEMEATVAEMRDRMHHISQSKTELEAQVQRQDAALAAREQRIRDLSREKGLAEQHGQSERTRAISLQEQLADMLRLKTCIETELQNRQQVVEAAQQQITTLERANVNLKHEVQRATDLLETLQTKVSQLKATQAQEQAALQQEQTQNTHLQQQVTQLLQAKGQLERDLQRELEHGLALELELKALKAAAALPPETAQTKVNEAPRGPILPQFPSQARPRRETLPLR